MKQFKLLSTLLGMCVSLCGQSQTIDTLISVGTYRLHFRITEGQGVPIVFESGGGDDGAVWNRLLKQLHHSTRATLISYDRAGLGKSEIDTTNITIENEVKGLETGLRKLGYLNRLLFVAHSLGGAYTTLFSERNPQVVKGVVFIDCNFPCFIDEVTAKRLKESLNHKMSFLRKESIGTYYSILNYEQSNAVFRQAVFPKTIPATVISSDIAPFEGSEGIRWKACQKAFGQLPNHRYVLARNSRHYVYKDNPQLVIDEITSLYKQRIGKK